VLAYLFYEHGLAYHALRVFDVVRRHRHLRGGVHATLVGAPA